MEEQIIAAKENFSKRFNPGRTVHDALNKAVNRSVQRAYVYTPGLTQIKIGNLKIQERALLGNWSKVPGVPND